MLVVITGANEGLGNELAAIFCKAFREESNEIVRPVQQTAAISHHVVLGCPREMGKQTAQKFAAKHGENYSDFVELEATEPDSTKQAAALILGRYGFVDTLVHCVSDGPPCEKGSKLNEAQAAMANYWGLRHVLADFLPLMKPNGRIVVVINPNEQAWVHLPKEVRIQLTKQLNEASIGVVDQVALDFTRGAIAAERADPFEVARLLALCLVRAVTRSRKDRGADLAMYCVDPGPIGTDNSLQTKGINLFRLATCDTKVVQGGAILGSRIMPPEDSWKFERKSIRKKLFVLFEAFEGIGMALARHIVARQPQCVLVIVVKSDAQGEIIIERLKYAPPACEIHYVVADHLLQNSVEKAAEEIYEKYGPAYAVAVCPSKCPTSQAHDQLSYNHFKLRSAIANFHHRLMPGEGRILAVLPPQICVAWTQLLKANKIDLIGAGTMDELDVQLYRATHFAIKDQLPTHGYSNDFEGLVAIFNALYLQHAAKTDPGSIKLGVIAGPSSEECESSLEVSSADSAAIVYSVLTRESVAGLNGCILEEDSILSLDENRQVPQITPIETVLEQYQDSLRKGATPPRL